MICNDRGDARREWTLTPDAVFVIKEGFEVHSALYGDGRSRYTDVTKMVQGWTESASWPENWEEVLYATRKPRLVGAGGGNGGSAGDIGDNREDVSDVSLKIHSAVYGVSGNLHGQSVDVANRVRELVKNNSLDIVVNNSTLTPDQNPFRGKKKRLLVRYSFDGGDIVEIARDEKDWLIIGAGAQEKQQATETFAEAFADFGHALLDLNRTARDMTEKPKTAAALNDYLIRKFSISPQRLRGPMPIELRDFHRNDLAQLFAELGFKRGAEIGVAEGNYSEVLLKANPECELLLVDPWHAYSENPQNKTADKHRYAYEETLRKVSKYPGASPAMKTSMEAVREIAEKIPEHLLDFCYIDANHLFDYVMQDLIEWSKRVRSGGIISGDDYYALDQKRWVGGGVVEAVQAYVNAHRIPVWWIFQGHKSTDYMWVKP